MGSSALLWLFFLAFLWGPSFLFIKIAVAEIPPLTMVALRVGIAALVLNAVLKSKGLSLPKGWATWKHFAVMGLFAHALPFFLFNYGEMYIDSALASVLNGATPLFTMAFAHFFIAEERMTWGKLVGILIGFQGLFILVSPALFQGLQATAFGITLVTLAAASYAVAIVYSKKNIRGIKLVVAPAAQLTVATLYALPISLIFDQPWTLAMPSLAASASMIALGVMGTALAFVVYYHIIEKAGATYLSTVTYLVPVFGVALGVMVLDESLTWHSYLGCALILAGVMVANGIIRIRARRAKTPVLES